MNTPKFKPALIIVLSLVVGSLSGCTQLASKPKGTLSHSGGRESRREQEPIIVKIDDPDSRITNDGKILGDLANGILVIDERGNPQRIRAIVQDTRNSKVLHQLNIDSKPEHLARSIRNSFERCILKKGSEDFCKQNVLVFIHGGVNTYEESLSRAIRDIPKIKCAHPDPDNPKTMCGKDQYHHVLFVSWPSGMLESFKDAIYNYDQGEWDTKTAHLLFPAKSIAEVASIVGKSPFNYLKTVAEFLKSASLSTDDRQTYCDADWRKRFNWESKYEKAILVDKICDPKKNHNERAEDAKYVATFPARLITTPAIGPMGRTMWDNMVARARFAFRRPCDLWDTDTRLGTPTNPTDANCGKGAAGIMFNAMQCAFNPESVSCVKHGKGDRRGKVGFDLTMIGHSMGTIVASEGINDYPNLPYKNIVFLGAAVSIREFLASVQPALQSRNMEFLNNTDDQSRQSESAIIDLVDVLKSANTPGAPDKSVKEVLTSIKSGYLREMDRLLQQRRGLSPTQSKRLDIIKIKLAKLQNIENSGIASLNSLRTAEKIIPEKPIYFYNLSLHPHAEARGTEFSGAVPSGSLLEWIDSFYTTPSDILERTMGKWVNVMNSYWAFDEDLLVPDPETRKISKDEKLEPIMHFKRFNLQDTSPRWHSCLAKANGDFNYWEENYWKSTSDSGNGNDSGKPGESAVCTPT